MQEEQLSAVVDWLTAQPRAAQLVDKDSNVVSTLEYHMGHYLKDVKRHYVKADKRYSGKGAESAGGARGWGNVNFEG